MRNKKSKRQYREVAAKQSAEATAALLNHVSAFLTDCVEKDEASIKERYKHYQELWRKYCATKNGLCIRISNSERMEFFPVAFANNVRNIAKDLNIKKCPETFNAEERLKYEAHVTEYKRICNCAKRKNILGKLAYWISKHFLVQSKKYKLNGDPKPQLKVVE